MENNKLSTGLTVWLWIIFVVNVLAAIGGIVVALGASVVGAALGLGSIYVVLSFIGVILQIVITVSIGILLFAHKKIGLVLIFAFAALGFIVSMVTYAVTAGMMRATSSSTTNLSDIYDNKTRGSDAPGFLYSKT